MGLTTGNAEFRRIANQSDAPSHVCDRPSRRNCHYERPGLGARNLLFGKTGRSRSLVRRGGLVMTNLQSVTLWRDSRYLRFCSVPSVVTRTLSAETCHHCGRRRGAPAFPAGVITTLPRCGIHHLGYKRPSHETGVPMTRRSCASWVAVWEDESGCPLPQEGCGCETSVLRG